MKEGYTLALGLGPGFHGKIPLGWRFNIFINDNEDQYQGEITGRSRMLISFVYPVASHLAESNDRNRSQTQPYFPAVYRSPLPALSSSFRTTTTIGILSYHGGTSVKAILRKHAHSCASRHAQSMNVCRWRPLVTELLIVCQSPLRVHLFLM
jgi:hypothetical protein